MPGTETNALLDSSSRGSKEATHLGHRGKRGVVLVTLKRGKAHDCNSTGKKPRNHFARLTKEIYYKTSKPTVVRGGERIGIERRKLAGRKLPLNS